MPKEAETAEKPSNDAPGEVIAAIKGFDAELKCRGFQFEVGKTYDHDGELVVCKSGFHAIEGHPFEVWRYYPPASEKGLSRYAAVACSGKIERHSDDSKVCAASVTVEVELSLPEFIQRGVDFIVRKASAQTKSNTGDRSAATNTGYQSAATNTGDLSAATNTGYRSAATNTGYQSAATNTGYQSAATNTGKWSAATNTGYQSAATNTGYQSAATNTGYRSAATNTGKWSAATNTGNWSAATNTGDRSAAEVSGKHSVAIVTGRASCARASDGSAIVLVERDDDGAILNIFAGIAGRDGVKPDVWYVLENGTIREVN